MPPENKRQSAETMSLTQIYTMHDARARDLRTVTLALFAALSASGAGLANAIPEPGATTTQIIRFCYFVAVSVGFFTAGMVCLRESKRNAKHAEQVRKQFGNHDQVPEVDRFLEFSEILRPMKPKVPDDSW